MGSKEREREDCQGLASSLHYARQADVYVWVLLEHYIFRGEDASRTIEAPLAPIIVDGYHVGDYVPFSERQLFLIECIRIIQHNSCAFCCKRWRWRRRSGWRRCE